MSSWENRSSERWSLWQSVKCAEMVYMFVEGSRTAEVVTSLEPYIEVGDMKFSSLSVVTPPLAAPAEKTEGSLVASLMRQPRGGYAVAEHTRVNLGQEMAFVEMVSSQWCRGGAHDEGLRTADTSPTSADADAAAVEMTVDILQDTTDTRMFLILYYFQTEVEIQRVRSSASWIKWRHALSSVIEGTSAVVVLRNVYHSSAQGGSSPSSLQLTRTSCSTPEAPHHPPSFKMTESKQLVDNLPKLSDALLPYQDSIRTRYDRYLDVHQHRQPCLNYADYLPRRVPAAGEDSVVVFRERYPGVKGLAIVGSWTNWTREYPFTNVLGTPEWECRVPNMPDGAEYKLIVHQEDDSKQYKISPWTTSFKLNDDLVANSVLSSTPQKPPVEPLVSKGKRGYDRIYQVHVGRCVEEERVGTYDDVRTSVLPWMKAANYDVLLLTGVQEHTYYPDYGWMVDSPLAVCSRFGNLASFQQLVNAAHRRGIKVIVQFVLSHLSSGINSVSHMPGLCQQQEHALRVHPEWDGHVINYAGQPFGKKGEDGSDVLEYVGADYVLTSCQYWLKEFGVDGFWFDGVPSVCYHDNAVNRFFNPFEFGTYFDHNANVDNQAWLIHLTTTLKQEGSPLLVVADYVGIPGLAGAVGVGGLGFDYTHSPRTRHVLTKLHKMSTQALAYELDRRTAERRCSGVDTLANVVVAKRSLHIAFFAWETLHTIAVGGIAPHVTELAAALRRVGHEVHIFTRATATTYSTKIIHGVFYHEVPFQLDRDFVKECENMCSAFVQRMLWYENEVGWTFDVCHGHDWLTARAVQCVSAGLGRTTVFTMHSTEAGRCGNKVFGGTSEKIRQLERTACHTAQRIICVSGVLADEVKSMYDVHSDKIRVTYNGCNVENFDGFEDAAPIKEKYGIKPMDPTVLFVGRFVVQKGVDILVEAVPDILKFRNDIKFVVVGDGHMREEVERRANELGVGYAMRFVGSKGGAELKSLFKMTDAVIVPSRNEPFGIVVLEAWSCYKPVIATTNGGPRDFVSPFSDGLLIDPNPSSIAWGVCEAMKDFDRLRQWGQAGNYKVKNSFSWTTIGSQTKNIYYELLNLSDAGYSYDESRGGTMAQHLVGDDLKFHMGVFDSEGDAKSGLTQLRLVTLLNEGLAADAVVSLQGSEFGHPDYVDLPRPGNHFAMSRATTMKSLALRKDLQFKHHLYFTTALGQLLRTDPSKDQIFVLGCFERVLIFERADMLFVFNLDNDRCYHDYVIYHRFGREAHLKLLLHTDMAVYGGWDRLDAATATEFETDDDSRITIPYLPCKIALVLGPLTRPHQDPLVDIDAFVDHFARAAAAE